MKIMIAEDPELSSARPRFASSSLGFTGKPGPDHRQKPAAAGHFDSTVTNNLKTDNRIQLVVTVPSNRDRIDSRRRPTRIQESVVP
jgi:hypothetical protein